MCVCGTLARFQAAASRNFALRVQEVTSFLRCLSPIDASPYKFAAARSVEISRCIKEVSKRHGGQSRNSSRRQRDLSRRRTSSHLRFRRYHCSCRIKRSGGQSGVGCRRCRRRQSNLYRERSGYLGYLRSRLRCRWLVNHVWFVKRFYMKKAWGWVLPQRALVSRKHQSRNFLDKAWSSGCILYDLSFSQTVCLKTDEAVLLETIRLIGGTAVCTENFRRGSKEISFVLTNLDGRPVCPVRAACFGGKSLGDSVENALAACVWFHPAATDQVFAILDAVKAQLRRNGKMLEVRKDVVLSRLKLRGPKTVEALVKALGDSQVLRLLSKRGCVARGGAVQPGATTLSKNDEACSGGEGSGVLPLADREEVDRTWAQLLTKASAPDTGYCPYLLVCCRSQIGMRGKTRSQEGWDLILRPTLLKQLWGRLVFSGVTVVGMEEWRFLRAGSGLRTFPFDWVETNTGLTTYKEAIAAQTLEARKRPLRSQRALLPCITPTVGTAVQAVQIYMCGRQRGRVGFGLNLYATTAEDVRCFEKQKYQWSGVCSTKLSTQRQLRDVVGYALSGGISLNGESVGIGAVTSSFLVDAHTIIVGGHSLKLALARRSSSSHCRPALLIPM